MTEKKTKKQRAGEHFNELQKYLLSLATPGTVGVYTAESAYAKDVGQYTFLSVQEVTPFSAKENLWNRLTRYRGLWREEERESAAGHWLAETSPNGLRVAYILDGRPLYEVVRGSSSTKPIVHKFNYDVKCIGVVGADAMGKMRSGDRLGAAWYSYQIKNLSHSQIGHRVFLQCGDGCTHNTPPVHAPDGSWGLGYHYSFEGRLDLETGYVMNALGAVIAKE